MRNARTRPVSWKICESEQLQKAIDKCGYLAESLFTRALVSRDNLGRMPADKYFLKGILYPKDQKVTPEKVDEILKAIANQGLVILYKVNELSYIQFPKIGSYSNIQGNMRLKSDHPEPPREVIREWEQRFNDVYTLYERSIRGVSPEGEGEGKGEGKGEGSQPKESEPDYISRVKNFFDNLDGDYLKQLGEAYPDINVDRQRPKMRLWLISNTHKRRKYLKRFISNWLSNKKQQKQEVSNVPTISPSQRSQLEADKTK